MRAVLVTTAALAALGCSRQVAVVEDSMPVQAGSRVDMYTFNGDITVEWYQGTEMDLSYQKTTWRGEGELDKVEVTVAEEGDATVIRAQKLQENARVGVDLDVRLPEGVSLGRVETSNGNVTVNGGTGDAIVDTSNGDIVFRGFAGTVRGDTSNGDIVVLGGTLRSADTSNGEIEAEIRSVQGSRTILDTSNGNIDVYLSPQLDVKVIMDTSNGSVSVSGLPVADIWLEDSEGTATLNAGTHELVLDTSNGDVRVYGLDD